jgi:hypothetical protein
VVPGDALLGGPVRFPDRTSSESSFGLEVTALGDGDALVATRGVLDDAAVAMLRGVLTALEGRRARRVLVDLTGSDDIPATVTELLDRLRLLLEARGGWLLVEGVPSEREPSLLDVFAAYSDAVAAPPSAAALVS